MDSQSVSSVKERQFAKEEPLKKTDFDTMVSSVNFVLAMGMLIMGAGMISYIAFRNLFSMYLLDIGLVLALYSFIVKVADVFLKVIGRR